MFTITRTMFLAGLILLYGVLFSVQEQRTQERETTLSLALPVNFYRITAGYGKQLAAEMLFIRTIVFLGGVRPGTPPTIYETPLANNFEVMTGLYPRFIDPYYFCNGFLPPISNESAARAASIFETGIAAYPEDLILRFFYGANFFLTMNEPLKAGQAFSEAAKLPDAPPLFGHLAALLSAQGGDIIAGLISLKTLRDAEKDVTVRNRYEKEIAIFDQAMKVQQAIKAYIARYGSAPDSLEQLVPDFLHTIPEIKDPFVLTYTPPNLHLKRRDNKGKEKTPH